MKIFEICLFIIIICISPFLAIGDMILSMIIKWNIGVSVFFASIVAVTTYFNILNIKRNILISLIILIINLSLIFLGIISNNLFFLGCVFIIGLVMVLLNQYNYKYVYLKLFNYSYILFFIFSCLYCLFFIGM